MPKTGTRLRCQRCGGETPPYQPPSRPPKWCTSCKRDVLAEQKRNYKARAREDKARERDRENERERLRRLRAEIRNAGEPDATLAAWAAEYLPLGQAREILHGLDYTYALKAHENRDPIPYISSPAEAPSRVLVASLPLPHANEAPWLDLLGAWLRELRKGPRSPHGRSAYIRDPETGVYRIDPGWVAAFYYVVGGLNDLDPSTGHRTYHCPDCYYDRGPHPECTSEPFLPHGRSTRPAFLDKPMVLATGETVPPQTRVGKGWSPRDYFAIGFHHEYGPEEAVKKLRNELWKAQRTWRRVWATDHLEDGDSQKQGQRSLLANPSRTDDPHPEIEDRRGPPLDELDERGGPRQQPRPDVEDEEDHEGAAEAMLGGGGLVEQTSPEPEEDDDEEPQREDGTPTSHPRDAELDAEEAKAPEPEDALDPDGRRKRMKKKRPDVICRDALGYEVIEAPCSPWRTREEADADPWAWPTPTRDKGENEKRKDEWCKFLREQAARRELRDRFAAGPRRRPLRDEPRTYADPVADDITRRAPSERGGTWLDMEADPLCIFCARPVRSSTPRDRRAASLLALGVQDDGKCRCSTETAPPGRHIEILPTSKRVRVRTEPDGRRTEQKIESELGAALGDYVRGPTPPQAKPSPSPPPRYSMGWLYYYPVFATMLVSPRPRRRGEG